MKFKNIIENVKVLTFEMKSQFKQLLEKYMIEERRSEIQRNYKKSRKEYQKGKLSFSSNNDELKRMF